MWKIRIIDSNNERGQALYNLVARFNCLPDARLKSIRDNEGTLINESEKKPDIFLLHINDQIKSFKATFDFLHHIIQELPSSVIVLYSGGSLALEKTQFGLKIQDQAGKVWEFSEGDLSRICVIQRPVNVGYELNIVVALEDYSVNRNLAEFFQILQFKQVLEYIESLSWLCQGYLAVTNPASLEQDEVQSIVSSWSVYELEEKRTLVSSPVEWWRKPFEPLEVSALRAKVREEWNSEEGWAPIEHLLNAIEDTKKIPLGVVNSAYKAISQRLSA